MRMLKSLTLCGVVAASLLLHAEPSGQVQVFRFDNEQQQQQYNNLIEELRCPKCQNQNLAGSNAVIAQDLKQKTYELVKQGKNHDEVVDYMVKRYGEFVTYKPRNKVIWLVPPILLLLVLMGWVVKVLTKPKSQIAKLTEQEQAELDAVLQRTAQNETNNTPTEV